MKQSAEKLWAVGSHIGAFLLGPFAGLAALIVFLMFKDRSKYVAHHAYQAMWLFFTLWIVSTVLFFLGPLRFLVYPLGIVAFCMVVVASLNALGGNWYEYPVVGRFWRKALGNS